MEFCEIRITREPLNAHRLNFSQNEGAVVDFFGVVRAIENDRIIDGIEYEAFEAMAERQLVLIAEDARDQISAGPGDHSSPHRICGGSVKPRYLSG